jgi:hypothetical protein
MVWHRLGEGAELCLAPSEFSLHRLSLGDVDEGTDGALVKTTPKNRTDPVLDRECLAAQPKEALVLGVRGLAGGGADMDQGVGLVVARAVSLTVS